MSLRRAPQGPKECPIWEKNEDAALLSVSDINGAAGVDRDPRRVAHASVLKGLQGSATRFKFVDKAGAGVGEENAAERIGSERHRLVEFARTFAFISPSAEELKRRRRLWLRRRIRAIPARNEKKYRGKRGLRKSPSHRIGIYGRHAANLRSEIVQTFQVGYYHALFEAPFRSLGKFSQKLGGVFLDCTFSFSSRRIIFLKFVHELVLSEEPITGTAVGLAQE
jgi:hypothetical protein